MRRRKNLTEAVFSGAAIVIVWNLQLATLIDNAAEAVGLRRGSIGRSVFVDLAIPAALVGFAAGSKLVYQHYVWPWTTGRTYAHGLWVYALIARTETEQFSVAGWFRLLHAPDQLAIEEARAYYIEDEGSDEFSLEFRGEWSSETIWLDDRHLSIVFQMRALGVTREPLPSEYHGFIQLTPRPGRGRLWAGFFHDLGDRRGVSGPIVGMRLSDKSPDDESKALLKFTPELRDAVLELVGQRRMRVPRGDPAEPPGPAVPADTDATGTTGS